MQAKLYKLIFDISVCYTIGAFLLKCVSGITIYGGSFLILLISALVSVLLSKKRKLKIVATILLPAVSLAFFLPSVPELAVFLLIWAYYSYISIMERFVIRRGKFIDMLKRYLCLCLVLPFLMLITLQNFSAAVQVTCPYLVMALVSAVFLLRHLRADHQMEQRKRYQWQQLIELLAFLVICLLLTLVRAPQNILEGLKLMYQHLLEPILLFLAGIIGMLLGGIIYLVMAAIRLLTNTKEGSEVKIDFGNTVRRSTDITRVKVTNTDWVVPVMYSIGAIIGIVLLFFFFRWLMGEKLKQKLPTSTLETREYLEEVKDKRAAFRKRRPKDSRETVRYYYGKCLLFLQHKKVELKPQDTTEEINNKYDNLQTDDSEAKREASVQLKQIYRKARYQMTEQISTEEAEKAKQLYQTIKTSKNLQ